jgi:hypothetical protein
MTILNKDLIMADLSTKNVEDQPSILFYFAGESTRTRIRLQLLNLLRRPGRADPDLKISPAILALNHQEARLLTRAHPYFAYLSPSSSRFSYTMQ